MGNGLTRTFDATYTSRDKKRHKLNVRVYKRLKNFGLSITLNRNKETYTLGSSSNIGEKKEEKALDGQDLSRDLELIEDIIKERGNGVQNPEELERDIASLESYFHDYLLNCTAAKIAKRPSKNNEEQSEFYRSVLFGVLKNDTHADENSIYGAYIEAYLAFHVKSEHTAEEKKEYADKLRELGRKTDEDLNLGGSINVVVPYQDFSSYLFNNTTSLEHEKSESFI